MPKDNMTIEIDGVEYENFTNVSLRKSLEDFTSSFRFTGAFGIGYNVKNNSRCRIFVNNKSLLYGYIEKATPSNSNDGRSMDFEGRCRTADLADSSLTTSINVTGGKTLAQIIKQVLASLGLSEIKIVEKIPKLKPFLETEIIDSEPDQNAFDFINQYAQKRSVILITDGDGNIVLTRASGEKLSEKLINKIGDKNQNNIISSTSDYNNSNRYNKITVISQENSLASGAEFSENSVGIKGSAIDSQIRKSRQLIIQAENASSIEDCQQIALFQVNIRRAKAFNYSCKVKYFGLSNSNIWEYNKLVNVLDQSLDIQAELLINAITYDYSTNNGSGVSLNLTHQDAYTLEAEMNRLTARQNKTGEEFNLEI